MSKSNKPNNTGAAASRSECAYKTLDSKRRFIDDLISLLRQTVNQTNHFFNLGYGWLCKHCSSADSEAKHRPAEVRGGQQEQTPALALAGWTDSSRHALTCPRCGIEETITNA
jgi:hypothetical protein